MKMLLGTAGTVVVLLCVPTVAMAQGDTGREEFESNCASCHGLSGKGDGPLAKVYMIKPSDLRTLSKRNGGVFPAQRAHEIIDGRQEVAAHGPRVMPVWGKEYRAHVPDVTEPDRTYDIRNAVAETRILALIDYLYRMQEKP